MLTILHELLPVIYTPIAQLFSRARVGMHFHTLFKTLKRIIKASNSPTGGPKRYVPVMARFTAELYTFLHESATNDDHSVEDALSWLVSLLAFAQEETLDLGPLLEALDSATYEHLLNELDQVVAFYDYRTALKELAREEDETDEIDETDETGETKETDETNQTTTQTTPHTPEYKTEPTPPTSNTPLPEVPRPNLTYIPLLVDNFITIIKSHLDHQATKSQSVEVPRASTQTQTQLRSKHANSSHLSDTPSSTPLAGAPKL
jgi:hypothetical protein